MAGKRKTTDQDLRAEILRLIQEPKYRPLDKIEIADALGYGAARRNEVRRVLRDLEQAGEIARIRKNRYVLPDAADLVTGTLSVHEAGYAFLTNEKPGQSDLFIAAENTGTAMHGDRVVARLEAWESRHVNPEGKIIELLGPRTAPGVDILSIIRKYHLPVEFPRAVLEETSAIPETVTADATDGREDLRRQFIVTIDPD